MQVCVVFMQVCVVFMQVWVVFMQVWVVFMQVCDVFMQVCVVFVYAGVCVCVCVCVCCVSPGVCCVCLCRCVCVCVCCVSPGVGCVWRSVQSGCGVRETVQQSLIIVFVLILQKPTLSDIDLLLSISLSKIELFRLLLQNSPIPPQQRLRIRKPSLLKTNKQNILIRLFKPADILSKKNCLAVANSF